MYNLKEKLNKEQDDLFEEFLNLIIDSHSEELEEKYIQGFKIGLRIAIEMVDMDLKR